MIDSCYVGDVRDGLRAMIAAGVRAQTCVTSPPYWGLRDYGTAEWDGGDPDCEHIGSVERLAPPGTEKQASNRGTISVRSGDCACGATRVDRQIGLEPTIDGYVQTMVEVFALVRDLLADSGTLWLNLGDSYNAYNGGAGPSSSISGGASTTERPRLETGFGLRSPALKPKDLCGIPWRVAFALQADGWWLRQDIIWAKPNPMPESVTDRCTKSHEYLFLLAKRERYYFDQDAISEAVTDSTIERLSQPTLAEQVGSWRVPGKTNGPMKAVSRSGNKERKDAMERGCPSSGVDGSVPWEGSRRNKRSVWTVTTQPYTDAHFAVFPTALVEPCILAGSRPGDVVLDPFMGSGTVAQVAQSLGRHWVGCELNPDYHAMIRRRTAQQGMRLEPTAPQAAETKEGR